MLAALVIGGPGPDTSLAGPPIPRPALPVAFDSEIVRLLVEEDSLRVEGTYRFLCRSTGPSTITLFYPYPEDSLLGGAHTESLEGRIPGEAWQPLRFEELPSGVRWWVPVDLGDTLVVRTVYRQALRSTYARYIVTSTQVWGRPLSRARFEVYLPEGAELERASFPFELDPAAPGAPFYSFETEVHAGTGHRHRVAAPQKGETRPAVAPVYAHRHGTRRACLLP
jgi:hypothetical protein